MSEKRTVEQETVSLVGEELRGKKNCKVKDP